MDLNKKIWLPIEKWLSLFLLIPLFWLCLFAHPAADDFPISHTARNWGSYTTVVGYYKCWSARYTSIFLMSINPIVFDSFIGYKLVPLGIIAGLFMAFRYLLLMLLRNSDWASIMALLYVLLYFYSIPDLSGGLYYLGGSLFYQPGNILMVLITADIFRYPPPKSLNRLRLQEWWRGFFQGILLFLLAGCNEIGMILSLAIPGIGFLASAVLKKEFSAGWLLLIMAAAAACLLILFSPATFYRMEASGGLGRSWTEMVLISFSAMISCIFKWISSPALLTIFLSTYFLPKNSESRIELSVSVRIGLAVLSFLLLFTCFIPSYLGEGMLQGHTENTLFFVFLTLVSFNIFLWQKDLPSVSSLLKIQRYLPFTGMVLLLTCSGFQLAVKDIVSGEAAAYSSEYDARYQLMRNTPGDTVRVPALKHKPKSLFAGDIGDYPDPWYDNHFAALFGKKWVELDEKSKAARKNLR